MLPYLNRARQEHYAIPLFNAFDMQGIEGIIRASEAKRAPVIVAVASRTVNAAHGSAFCAYIRQRAAVATTPVSLMLDHGDSFATCIKAISFGFTDIMFDGSKLPFEQNLAVSRAVTDAAHACGLGAEMELGHVGMGSDYQSFGAKRLAFTDPEQVSGFAKETGADSLAVAIGNAHGVYAGEPHIDIDLLRDIRSRVDINLVLHGGSGIPEEQFRAAIAAGISKINIATDLFMATARNITEATKAEKVTYFTLIDAAIASFQGRCEYFFDLFGTTGNANVTAQSSAGQVVSTSMAAREN
jgi:ketose-bisphosphate aldolase